MSAYLIKSEGIIYTVIDGQLQALGDSTVTASLFQEYGVDNIPDSSLLVTLSSPSLLCWESSGTAPNLVANVTATPKSQNITTNAIDLTDASITGIESALADCDGDLIIAVSFDNKITWKAWNGNEWITLSGEFTGMSKENLESITLEQWNLQFSGASSMYLRVALTDTSQVVRTIKIDFSN